VLQVLDVPDYRTIGLSLVVRATCVQMP